MTSVSYRRWRIARGADLDQIAQAHAAVGGTQRGRRYATQQINHAYAVLLASQFQGFCRDLHTECVNHLLSSITCDPITERLILAEFTRNRRLDHGNAHPASLAEDFNRLGVPLWSEVQKADARSTAWKSDLEMMNSWRNAIAHQDFAKVGGANKLQLVQVRRWHSACNRLARVMDHVMRQQLHAVTGAHPW